MKKFLAGLAIAASTVFAFGAHAGSQTPSASQQFLSLCGQKAGCEQFISGFMGMQMVSLIEINRFMSASGQPSVNWTRWCIQNGMELNPDLVLNAVLRSVEQHSDSVAAIVATPDVPNYQKATIILTNSLSDQFACPRPTY